MTKNLRPKTYGFHPFNRKEMPAVPSLIDNFEEMPSPPQKIAEAFKFSKCEALSNDAKIRVFLLSEFTKRKFYLDCLMEKDGSRYKKSPKTTRHYVEKEFSSWEECFNNILNTFILPEDGLNFYIKQINTNKTFIESIQRSNYNIYKIIKYNYDKTINIIQNIISLPDNFKDYIRREEDREFLRSQSKDMTPYSYERLLFMLSEMRMTDRVRGNNSNISKRLIQILDSCWYIIDSMFLQLFHAILDRYSMYLCDLLDITSSEYFIKNGDKLECIPRFFFLPLEPEMKPYIEKRIKFEVDSLNDNINISINLSDNIDSSEVIDYIDNTLLVSLYYYKETRGKNFSNNEINAFINKIGFAGKYNTINDPTNFLYGLWIWDKINIENSNKSINNLIQILLHQLNYDILFINNKSIIRKFRRYYDTIRKSIEELTLCRITS